MKTLSARASPRKPPSLEKFRETWQRQILADQKALAPGAVYVAIAISWHMNRDKGGLAWPGIRTLARLVDMWPSTVVAAIGRLERRGHLQVTRSRKERERGVNRYLPKLKSAASPNVRDVSRTAETRTPCSIQTRTPCSIQTRTEPLTEPPTEPLSYKAAVGSAAVINRETREEKRSGEEVRRVEASFSATPSKPGIPQRCYELVRRHYPGKLGLVTRALEEYPESDVLDWIEECIESGDDIGHALWVVGN